ncbi:MAG: hypothetical protein ACI8QC_000525 [Planctomycetota bacterium]|jgi:hypothetical protein
MSREQLLQLGEDYLVLDQFETYVQAQGRTACVSCPGSARTPFKPPGQVYNEDALLVVDDGEQTLLAVADAHYGERASHELMARLATRVESLPSTPMQLLELLLSLGDEVESDSYRSETTLLIAVLDRARGAGFGVSMGDSSLSVLGLDNAPRTANRKTTNYARACVPSSLDPRRATEFAFNVRPNELVLAYTDGVDECHYRSPRTSIGLRQMESLHIRTGGDPQRMATELTQLALDGVQGYPGGQDNIALIVTRV